VISAPSHLKIGELYTNEEIFRGLGVGNAGGLRYKLENEKVARAAVFTSIPSARKLSENPYHDRIENEVLIYTAAGREGDQTLAGVNQRLPNQAELDFPIHGFLLIANRKDTTTGPKRWQYLGLLEYLRHFRDSQIDSRGNLRNVWVFELRVHSHSREILLEQDAKIMHEILEESRRKNQTNESDQSVALRVSEEDSTSILNSLKIEALRGKLLAVPPRRFEHLLKDLLAVTGFTKIEVTRFSQDGGIDLNAHSNSWALGNCLLQIQAKRWAHTVGRKEVAELRGSLQPFAKGTLVTTSHFTKSALLEAREIGKLPIHLVDGYDLARAIIDFNVDGLCV
jgi:HJR/Mrr/RecB family endonuclease